MRVTVGPDRVWIGRPRTLGSPLPVLPLSTDLFAAAAALEDSGYGESLHPDAASPSEIRDAVGRLLALSPAGGEGWVGPGGQRRSWSRVCSAMAASPRALGCTG